jgi:serine/threonine protein kinase
MDNFSFRRFSKETKDIIMKMLIKNPDRRITPEMALKHKYFVRNGFAK